MFNLIREHRPLHVVFGAVAMTLAGIVFFLLIVLVAAPSHAAVGKPFLHGVNSPADLASKVEASLAKNPKGTSIIDPERCKRDGSCATPENYLKMFQESDPTALLIEVAQVPDFLRTLQVQPAPAGEYWLACLKPSGKGTFTPALHCLSRVFKTGEKVWVDPKSGRLVLASDCTNPIEKPKKEECVEVHFFAKPFDSVVRFALLGPRSVSNDCLGVKRAGDVEFERFWADECPVAGCDFSDDSRVVGQPVQEFGSLALKVPGEYILRLPVMVAEKNSPYVTVLCLERGDLGAPPKVVPEPTKEMSRDVYALAYDARITYIAEYKAWRDTWIAGHSDGMGVRWMDYVYTTPAHVRYAQVWYTKSDIPSGAPERYWPFGDWARLQEDRKVQEQLR